MIPSFRAGMFMKSHKSLLRRIHNSFFHRLIARSCFEVGQSYHDKPLLRQKIAVNVSQFLNEKGFQTPLILTKNECLEFWVSMGNASSSIGNRPEVYATKGRGIIDFLHTFWTPEVQIKDSLLELGCNCGANLYWLNEIGYSQLSGVEISPAAVRQMRESFPSLAQRVPVHLGAMDAWLKNAPSRSVDVIFTMGVSMHIHPVDNFVFREMTRVSKKYICTVEPESENSNYVFSRNYRRIFERLGASQVKEKIIRRQEHPDLGGYIGCTARLFKT